jgi:hypothetical protein
MLGVALLAVSTVGCGVDFDSISQIEGLRVLGVQKSQPFAEPGETVDLRLLYHDTGVRGDNETEGEPRDISLFWLSGCENPPGDLYALCLEGFARMFEQAGVDDSVDFSDLDEEQAARLFIEAAEAGIRFGDGETFSLDIADDIISRRPPVSERGVTRYGLNHVFFAACAGELELDPAGDTFPIRCVDGRGRDVTSRDFVAGYTSVFSYDGLSNDNPRIEGIEIEGERLANELVCLGAECQVVPPDPNRECQPDDFTIPHCEDQEDEPSCERFEFQALIDPNSVDLDGALSRQSGKPVEEQMWVNYHTDRGKLKFDVALVNDVVTGFNGEPSTEYIASGVPGPAHVWAVVRDNRGGVDWARFRICVE